MAERDVYKTVKKNAETVYKQRSSKFLTFIYNVESLEQIKPIVDKLRKQYYDATHHCYAYRLGINGDVFRSNDDGEPSGTAGKPILGQMLSNEITNCLIVVVRYFGGTKLGVSGLIEAYKQSAADAIAEAGIEERTLNMFIKVQFAYVAMNDVMKIIKDEQLGVASQEYEDMLCSVNLIVREASAEMIADKLAKIDGVKVGYMYTFY